VNDFLPSLAIGCMAMDPTNPSIMYAGTGEWLGSGHGIPGAGVFKSIDGGSTWFLLTDTGGGAAPWRYVTRLAIDPFNGQHILASTPDGIHLSHDGGISWFWVSFEATTDVRFHPTSSQHAVAGLFYGAAQYTTDGGATWEDSEFNGSPFITSLRNPFVPDGNSDADSIDVESTVGLNIHDLIQIGTGGTAETVWVVDKVDHDHWVNVEDLEYSHSTGETVESQIKGRVEVAYASYAPNIVFAAMNVGGGTIYKSTDGGATFDMHSNPDFRYMGKQGDYNNSIWVSPDEPDFIVLGGVHLCRSYDGGERLVVIANGHNGSAHVDQHAIVSSPTYDGVSDRRVYIGNDGGIYRADDIYTVSLSGQDWTNLNNNLGITQFYAGAAEPFGNYILGGTQDNGTLRYRPVDGPQNWHIGAWADGGFCAINPIDPSIQYASWQNLNFMKSVNSGESFFDAVNGLDEAGDGPFVAPFSMDPNDPDIIVAGAKQIWRTTDAAANWVSTRPAIPNGDWCSAIDIAHGNSNLIWVGYQDGLVSRTQGTVTSWVDVDDNGATPIPERWITDIAINQLDHNEVFVTIGGHEDDTVWRTSDGGANWEQRTGSGDHALPSITITTIRFHPIDKNWIYVGTDLGIYASEDKGFSWSRVPRFGDHEGPVNTQVAELFWEHEHLIAATHGRGMYRTRPLHIVYVDWSNQGPEDGSFLHPFDTIQEAIDVAGNGTTISIATGSYPDLPLLFYKSGPVVATGGHVWIP
jgi:photosystem II stability/assembly factor-like uncharacterized protein